MALVAHSCACFGYYYPSSGEFQHKVVLVFCTNMSPSTVLNELLQDRRAKTLIITLLTDKRKSSSENKL
jgi:hypothetical protein